MTTRKTKTPLPATREEAETVMKNLASATYALTKLEGELNIALAAVRAKYADQIAVLQLVCERQEGILKKWADANRETLLVNDKRCVDMMHGTIEFRLGNHAVKIATDRTEEDVLNTLESNPRWRRCFVRCIREINREQIIADRESLTTTELEMMGVSIKQSERIHVTPKLEEVS